MMRKLRKQAKELLRMASKVYHYRRDLISEAELVELEEKILKVESMCADETVDSQQAFEAAMANLDKLLRKVGGKIYPKTFWSDNLEVLLVAAIVVIGVRTFFFQPFIIPTNSMYPTYNGMTYEIYDKTEVAPSVAQRILNKIRLGTKYRDSIAKKSGSVSLLLVTDEEGNLSTSRKVPHRKFFIVPSTQTEYLFSVEGIIHSIKVPLGFNLLPVVAEFFPNADLTRAVVSKDSPSGRALALNKEVKEGEPILRFDINLGDALFVDRISYHFRQPKVGEPIVFRTREISEELGDKYYIKRLAGVGGETLEILDGTLLVNGKPRDEADAFISNSEQSGEYEGYVNTGNLDKGLKWKIDENSFVALGDNSDNSRDSRSWGLVPEKTVIGKALFIYYPFNNHWGLAQ